MLRKRSSGLNPRRLKRVGIVSLLLAQLVALGVQFPQSAFASPTITLPTTLSAGTSFASVNSAGALSISGYSAGASVQATIGVDEGFVKITTTTGLTAPAGYTSAAWTADTSTEIAFFGTEANVSTALNSLQYKASGANVPATISVTTFLQGGAFNSATGTFYEIVNNGSAINWELARCKALYSNSDVSYAGTSLLNSNGCSSSTTLTRRVKDGLRGYLANITSLSEQEFIRTKSTGVGWIGGADTDVEGTFIWMDGPEKGQVFWTGSGTRRTTNTVTGSSTAASGPQGSTQLSYGTGRFNYWSDGEPNNASNEDFAEFGFGNGGVGSSWNDCRNGCGRSSYIIEYGDTGDTLSGASGAINVNPRVAISTDTDTALSFSGSNQYAMLDGTILPTAFNSPFTLEAWVYPTDAGSHDIIFSQGSGSNRFYIKRSGGNLIWARDGWGSEAEFNCGGVPTSAWSHIALSWNGTGTASCYINGNLTLTTTRTGLSGTLTSPAVVGQYSADLTFPDSTAFAGQIDELKIWNSVRDASQILTSSNTRIDTSDADLLVYFDFNEGSGNTLYNRESGATYATDLTIGGSPSWTDVKTVSTSGPYTVTTFLRSYINSSGGWNVPAGVTKVSALVVGGGGGGGGTGGRGWSGGGGAGGRVISQSTLDLNSDSSVIIKIGQGGQGGTALAREVSSDFAQSGQSSIFGNLIAPGGGAGGHAVVGPNFGPPYPSTDLAAPKNGGGGGASAAFFNGADVDDSNLKGGNGFGSGTAGLQAAGGGAGSLGSGEDASSGAGGAGGAGVSSSISGASLTYGGGGGGGKRENSGSAGVGNDGGGNGGLATFGGAGINNRGGGGGGAGVIDDEDYVGGVGGSGGSGIIIIRWLTAATPTFTAPVAVDTTTAGLQHTFQISGAAISPLTRSFIWQSSSDTGTSWINIQASASNSLTTSTLETTTSGARYLYRAIVTDSDIYGLSITDTSTAFYLVINPRITISGISFSLTQKYGESQTATFDFAFGTETRTATFSPGGQSGISWSDISSDSATITLASGLNVGTYYETITVTDSVTAQTIQMLTFTVTQADSITVSALDITTTYAPNTPVPGSYSITGLQNNESATATLNYQEGEVDSSTPTPPTDAGTYSVSPSSFTLLNGADIANYAGVIYESATVVIDRAPQVRLTIGQYNAFRGISTYPVNVYGGSDIGAITVSVIDSSTSGCLLVSERALTAANVGNCTIQVVKAGTRNYLTETATATFYWIEWVANNTVQALPGANTTPLTGGNSVEKSEVVVTANSFTNTSGDGITSSSVGNTIRILITGYEGLDPLDIDVIFRPYQYVEVISDLTST